MSLVTIDLVITIGHFYSRHIIATATNGVLSFSGSQSDIIVPIVINNEFKDVVARQARDDNLMMIVFDDSN